MARSILLLIIIILGAMWFIIRPGLYIISPMPNFEKGTMLFYYDRHPNIPFYYSTDLQCLRTVGETDEQCRQSAYSSALGVRERTLFSLPFSQWAYQRSQELYP
ncbi:MAG: hypothetical protein PVF85_05550 [Anaerolineales bacterium]|jgi:hypothetical protein